MKLRSWLFVIVPLVAAGELGAHLYQVSRTPTDADYADLGRTVPGLARLSEPIVVAPRWAEPHVRKALGPRFFPLRSLARAGVETFDRAIEISLHGARSEELAGFTEVSRDDVGPFRVRVMKNPAPVAVTYDFVDHVDPGSLVVERTVPERGDDGAPRDARCGWSTHATVLSGGLAGHPTFPRERFVCGPDGFFDVSVTVIADQGFLPRRCIFAHPSRTGDLVLRFSDVPLGDAIVGHSGMYWVIERSLANAPVELEVRIDGEIVGNAWHHDGQGFAPFSIPLGKFARTEKKDVELRVRSPNYVHRHFCFEARSR